jgi:hypothetical protein
MKPKKEVPLREKKEQALPVIPASVIPVVYADKTNVEIEF